MKGRKSISILFMLLFLVCILTLTSCHNSEPSLADKQGNNDHEKPAAASDPAHEQDWVWQQIGPDKASISQVQVASDGNVFLLSEGKLYFLQSDGLLEIGPQAEIVIFYLMEFNDERIIYAGAKGGELYTKKGDDAWEKTVSPVIIGQPISAIASDNKRGIVYVGQSGKNGGGLWKSCDQGRTWEQLTAITVRTVVVHPQEEDYLYIVDKAVYLSKDGGAQWKKIDVPANYGLLIHPQDSEVIYLAYAKGVVAADPKGTVLNNNNFKLPGVMTCLELNFSRQGEWAVSMWDYPSGCGGLYFSFDKGSTWIKYDEEMDQKRILDMRFDPKGDKLYLGTAGHGLWMLNLPKIR